MRRVGQHHGGLRYVGLHLAAARRALQVADAPANLRVALGLLVLVAQILATHLQPLLAALPLHQVVDQRPGKKQPCSGQQHPIDFPAQQLQTRG